MKRLLSLLFLAWFLAGSVGPVAASGRAKPGTSLRPKPNLAKPRDFCLHLYKLARTNRADLWGKQLSAQRRARGPVYVKQHFKSWRQGILSFAAQIGGRTNLVEASLSKPRGPRRQMKLTIWNRQNPKQRVRITVIKEGGRLVIDEN